ncbi:hypothetical protein [Roseovarius sp.]|uniref:hypothetical protein n=1 Tax=Roseovarius sp. TaxID=1486281 RepID=UPI00261537A0|nr:hypothetical protein [Roseovarius sp.]MDM8166380.1 hypothetical protein [Roseovarius sp.]
MTMLPVSAPLKLSAASMRMAGYVIENNLRVAQVFGRAAFRANPFLGLPYNCAGRSAVKAEEALATDATPPARKTAAPAKPAAVKTADKKTAAKPAPAKKAEAKPAPAPAKKAEAKPAPAPAKKAEAKPAPAKKAEAAKPAAKAEPAKDAAKPEATADAPKAAAETGAKRPRQPSAPPAMPPNGSDSGKTGV